MMSLIRVRHFRALTSSEFHVTGPQDVLIVDGLKKNFLYRFNKFSPVKDVNFVVSVRQCFGLLGSNGAGKSTVFKILSANMVPSAGNVVLHGVSMMEELRKVRSTAQEHNYCK